ncbi:hypothetical protein MHYP_G00129120 [Metynnis hypsauchen]
MASSSSRSPEEDFSMRLSILLGLPQATRKHCASPNLPLHQQPAAPNSTTPMQSRGLSTGVEVFRGKNDQGKKGSGLIA